MLESTVRLKCDVCERLYLDTYCDAEDVSMLMQTAEFSGWKVNRLARDVYYGKAWCPRCREDRCRRCDGRGYYPDWSNWGSYHGEPARKECEECDGKGR